MSREILKNNNLEIFIKATAYSMIAGGLILIFGKKIWWPNYYSPIYFGLIFLTSAGLIILSQYIYKPPDRRRRESIVFLRLAVTAALVLNILGELYFYQLYKYGFQYDKMLHFINAFLFMAVLTSFYEKWHNFKLGRALKFAAIIVAAGSLLWEIFEFLSDFLFKTSVFGVYGQYVITDTIFDILSDLLGLITGVIFVTWFGWGNLFNKLVGYNRRVSATKIFVSGRCFSNTAAK